MRPPVNSRPPGPTGELQRLGLAAADGIAVPLDDIAPAEVERLMNRAHAAGITGVHHSFRDLVRGPGGALAFGDVTRARRHRPQSIHFVSSRDVDRQAFNEVFGTSIPIESPVRPRNGMLLPVQPPRPSGTSAGGTARPAAGASGGLGPDAWRVFLDQIVAPLVAGKRVLALGSSGGSVPLLLLQAGAREVVAVEETHPAGVMTGMTMLAISWRDVQPYDTQVLDGDMRGALTLGLGRFDVITAFRPLQYLPEDQLRDVVSRAAGMSAVLIFQACDVIDTLPATTLNLHRLMRDHGYEVQVHTLAARTARC